jgi:hypothetical protein
MRSGLWSLAGLAVLASACTEDGQHPALTGPEELVVPVVAASAGAGSHFGSHLSGREEVPMRDTRAQGQATFKLSADGLSLEYKLVVANIEDVTQAHIHVAPAGVSGAFVAWLYPSGPPAMLIPGRSQGVLGQGVITAANLVGDLAGESLDALLDLLRNGGAYVNVHTELYPPGEIRGQIR